MSSFTPSWSCMLPAQLPPPTKDEPLWEYILNNTLLPMRKRMGWNRYYPDVSNFLQQHFADERRRGGNEFGARLRIVEIGTAYGGNANHMLRTIANAEVCAVDPFMAGYDKHDATSLKYSGWSQKFNVTNEQFSTAWAQAMAANLNMRYGCRYHLMHMPSLRGASFFNERSLDVVFIDGLHTYRGVKDDLAAWAPKVRERGLLLFNDFGHRNFPGVKQAVLEFANASVPRLEVVVGSEERLPGAGNAYMITGSLPYAKRTRERSASGHHGHGGGPARRAISEW